MMNVLEQKLEAIKELSCDGYWEWTIGMDDLYLSDRFIQMLGYDRDEVGDEMEWVMSLVMEADLKKVKKIMRKYSEGKIKKHDITIKYKHKNGKILIMTSKGKIIGDNKLFGMNTDISKWTDIENKLKGERDKALASNKSSKMFLANMSHEIRTPMNSIVALSDLMIKDDNLGIKHREYMNCIVSSANILLKLLGDILEYSKLESLELSINNKKCDMRSEKSLIYNTWKEKVFEKGLEFTVYMSKKVPEKLVMDKQRFMQVVNILMSNALKYTNKGEISVKVYMSKGKLAVRVNDTGVGIPKESFNDILDPFVRANTRKEGTGIGLSIANVIVKKLGGKLWFKSDIKKGSEFYFTYPVIEDYEDYSSDENMCGKYKLENIDVLVVEDSKVNQFVMKELLNKFPEVRYDFANCGEDAVVSINNKKYDIVFMDIVMPGIDGVETAKELMKIDSSMYIVAATANSISGDREKYTKIMNDYISKPILVKDLENIFNKYMRFRKKQDI